MHALFVFVEEEGHYFGIIDIGQSRKVAKVHLAQLQWCRTNPIHYNADKFVSPVVFVINMVLHLSDNQLMPWLLG